MPQLEARITGVQHDETTGWYRIATDSAKVKRLDTKDKGEAREAAQYKKDGVLLLITYNHVEKPREDGGVWNNYYWKSAMVAGGSNGSSADDGIESVVAVGRTTPPNDAWRMTLCKAADLAVATMPLMPAEQRTFETQKQVYRAWARTIWDDHLILPGQATETALDALSEFADVEGADDDIPF